jgi:hypothetical protein
MKGWPLLLLAAIMATVAVLNLKRPDWYMQPGRKIAKRFPAFYAIPLGTADPDSALGRRNGRRAALLSIALSVFLVIFVVLTDLGFISGLPLIR